MSLKVKDSFEHQVTYTKEDVKIFANLTKDTNPLHLDEAFAARSIFKKLIVPGFLSAAVFSKVFGTMFPGQGTIYLSQDMKFKKPVFIDEMYTARFVVLEVLSEKNRARVSCSLTNEQNEVCIEGDALIMNKEKIV